jgi:hypothetical protein
MHFCGYDDTSGGGVLYINGGGVIYTSGDGVV